VKAALVKTAAVINKAAVTLRLIVHPWSGGTRPLDPRLPRKVGACASASGRLDGDIA
jgi:hypothetical protein